MRTISWTCQLGPDWQWLGDAGIAFPVPPAPSSLSGTITLPPNPDYWHPCSNVVFQGTAMGNTYLRYFQNENGEDRVQARAVAQNNWASVGDSMADTSITPDKGGITLTARLS